MGVDLPLVWAVIILAGIMMYVVMDGFDLGIGILFPLVADDEDRDVMMNSVAPVWDGNETWLVLGGAGLLAAFPLAYSVPAGWCGRQPVAVRTTPIASRSGRRSPRWY